MNERAPERDLRQAVLDSLRTVIDPELGENLVDLGLIYRVEADAAGAVRIEMTTTTRGCPAAAFLKEAAHSAASLAPGAGCVAVLLTDAPPWSPDMMSEAVGRRFAGGEAGQ